MVVVSDKQTDKTEIEWRMEVLSLSESTSIRPVNRTHHSFLLLLLGMLHLSCCALAFHDLSVAADKCDEGWLPASEWMVGVPPARGRPIEDSPGWALSVEGLPTCSPFLRHRVCSRRGRPRHRRVGCCFYRSSWWHGRRVRAAYVCYPRGFISF
jgi:hypothetical protein